MNFLFLEQAVFDFNDPAIQGSAAGALIGAFAGLLIFFIIAILILAIAGYIYTSYAFMVIGRRNKLKSPGLAWIPIVGPGLIASKVAKMHWWPLLLLIGFWIPYLGSVLAIVYTVFFVIWMWKVHEAVKQPGWFGIFQIIPFVNFVFIGIAAWKK